MLGLILRVLGGVVLGGAAVGAAVAVGALVCITVSAIREKIKEKYRNAVSAKITGKFKSGDYKVVEAGIYDDENNYLGEETFRGESLSSEIKNMQVGDIIELY